MMTILAAGLAAGSTAVVLVCILRFRLRQMRAENQRLRQALQLGQHRSQELEQQLNALRELRHDLRHYLQGSVPPQWETLLHAPLSSADVFSAMADRYQQRAKELGASVDVRLCMDALPNALLPDVYLILSNLLENAVEALEREGGGWLRVRSLTAPGYLTLVVGNSSHAVLRTFGSQYLSSKAPGRLGIGLQTVRRIAGQYGGDVTFAADGQEFRASVFLPLPPKDNAVKTANAPGQD